MTHCARSCDTSPYQLSTCPAIMSITPSYVLANSDAQQTIMAYGGYFYNDVTYVCMFDDIPAQATFFNDSVVYCDVPVFLLKNAKLTIMAFGQPYTNSIDVEVFGTLQYCIIIG